MSHQPVVLEHNNEEALAILIGMGFNQRDAELALRKSGNDLNAATEYLTSGRIEDDAEFDLIAAAGPEPSVRAPTVFHPRIGGHDGPDHFADVTEGSISEMVDSRIAALTEMGFTHIQAEAALQRANQDFNEALTLLLMEREEESS